MTDFISPGTTFDIGDKPVITATFTDITGGSAVSSACTFITKDPVGTLVTYSTPNAAITNATPNVYKLTMPTITLAGTYKIRAKSTATLIAAVEGNVGVRPSEFASP